MTALTYPNDIQDGDEIEAGPVMANFEAVRSLTGGNLEMGTNVQAGSPVALDGNTSSPGSALTGARSDHQHIVRGVERLTADPTTGNFLGREYVNTSSAKKRFCINPAGSGSFITIGNASADELVDHASTHADGAADPLPAVSVADKMLKRSKVRGVPATDIALVASTFAGNTIASATFQTAPGAAQLVHVTANVHVSNNAGGDRNLFLRLRDVTGVAATIWRSGYQQLTAAVDSFPLTISFYYLCPATSDGAHTIELQGNPDGTNVVVDKDVGSVVSDSGPGTYLDVVVG